MVKTLAGVGFGRFWQLAQRYYYWIAFTLMLNVLNNAAGSLTLIRTYQFPLMDMALTYGFMVLVSALEAAILTGLITLIQLGLEKVLHAQLGGVVRRLILLAFGLTWLHILLTALNLSLY